MLICNNKIVITIKIRYTNDRISVTDFAVRNVSGGTIL